MNDCYLTNLVDKGRFIDFHPLLTVFCYCTHNKLC